MRSVIILALIVCLSVAFPVKRKGDSIDSQYSSKIAKVEPDIISDAETVIASSDDSVLDLDYEAEEVGDKEAEEQFSEDDIESVGESVESQAKEVGDKEAKEQFSDDDTEGEGELIDVRF